MHVCAYTHTHPSLQTPPCADFSSSCSFLLGTLKPVHISGCPSLQTSISPSLPFCYISCISASLPHFVLCLWVPFSLHTLCSESVIKYFIMSLWTKWNVALPSSSSSSSCTFFFFFYSSAPVASQSGFFFLPAVSCMQPRCNTKPF